MKILIFGQGYLGKRFAGAWPDAILSPVRIDDKQAVLQALDEHKPDAVINAAGRNGVPNVDWCETHQVETFHGNTVAALLLAEACQEKGVYLIQLSSGCIFYGTSPDSQGWKEEDPTNPAAFYSRTKYATDLILSRLPNTAVVRLRLPIDYIPSPKNLITKLSGYKSVIDVQNSVTILEDLMAVLRALIEKRGTGIFHATNPGPLRYRDMLGLYREMVNPEHTCEWIQDQELATRGLTAKNRSTCILQSTRLAELGIQMRPVDIAIRDTMQKYAAECLKAQGQSPNTTGSSATTALPSFPHFLKTQKPEWKGVIAAGGLGTRLAPLTNITNKHLLPIHNRPMILYPLQTLLDAGIKDVLVVTGPNDAQQFVKLLGSGARFGCNITYRIQDEPGGTAQALGLAEQFVGDDHCMIVLGDNLFEGNFQTYTTSFQSGAATFYKPGTDPEQTGLFLFDATVFEIAKNLFKDQKELEIKDVLNQYRLEQKLLTYPIDGFWTDVNSLQDLQRASDFFAKRERVTCA